MIGMAYQYAAREYVAVGMAPLPVSREDGKRPLVSHPDKFGRRAALLIAPKFPDANLGIWCGLKQGGSSGPTDDREQERRRWLAQNLNGMVTTITEYRVVADYEWAFKTAGR